MRKEELGASSRFRAPLLPSVLVRPVLETATRLLADPLRELKAGEGPAMTKGTRSAGLLEDVRCTALLDSVEIDGGCNCLIELLVPPFYRPLCRIQSSSL